MSLPGIMILMLVLLQEVGERGGSDGANQYNMGHVLDDIVFGPSVVTLGVCQLDEPCALVWQPDDHSEDEANDADTAPSRCHVGSIAHSRNRGACEIELIVDVIHVIVDV
jgi:hypothetical protein